MIAKVLISLLLTAAAVLAQTAVFGAVHGTVLDPSGAVLRDATARIQSESLSLDRAATTDARGEFRFVALAPAADYRITVRAAQFEPWESEVEILSGEPVAVTVRLTLAASTTAVNIEAAATSVISDTAEIATSVNRRSLESLPTNGRFLNRFALLDARVRNTAGLGGDASNLTRLSINGTIFRETQYRLDGNSNYDTLFNNAPLQRLSLSAVQEFRVLTNQFNAEHGSTSVGLVIATTKSGTDELHGEALFFARPSGLQSRPPLSPLRVPNQLWQTGASVGGPIVRGRTYYFANFERLNQDRGSFISSPSPGFFVGEFRDNMALAKIDHRFSDNHWSSIRLNGQRETNTNANDRVGGLVQASAAVRNALQTVGAQWNYTTVWRSRIVTEVRAGYINAVPSKSAPVAPGIVESRPGYGTFGAASFSTLRNEVYQLADQVSWQSGKHSFKAGGDFIRRKVRDLSFDAFGTYTFPGGAPAPDKLPILYTQRFGVARLSYGQTQWAGFLQDTYRVVPRLTLNLGVRYDYQSLLDDANNFGPRASFAWDVRGNGATVIRGGFGLYYDQPFFHGLTQRFLLNSLDAPFSTYSITPSQAAFPAYPFSYAPTAAPPGLSLAPRNLVLRGDRLLSPYTTQLTFGFAQRLPGQWTLTVDGIRSLSVKQFLHYNFNAPAPFVRMAAGQVRTSAEADRTRPLFDAQRGGSFYRGVAVRDVRLAANGNTATYHGLDVRLSRRFATGYQVSAHYVLSSAINAITDDHLGANPQEWSDVQRGERAFSDFAQRHRFVVSGLAMLPWKLQLSAFAVAASGLPVNAITGVDNNGDTTVVDRPAGFGRNAFRGTPHRNVDASLARTIQLGERTRLQLRVDVFNVFNNQNYYRFNNVFGNGATPVATFMRPVGGIANVDPARQFTFGARLFF